MSAHVFLEENLMLSFPRTSRNAAHVISYFPFPLPVHLSVSPTRACTELSVRLSEHRLHLRCSRHSVLLCNCCLSPSFLPSPNLKHPTSLCSSQLWGICLIHLCIPRIVHEPYRWTKRHDWIRKWLVCLSLFLQFYVRILTAISVSDMRHKEGIRRAGMVPFQ